MLKELLTFSKAAAWRIVGGLSRTTKMPCHSWGLPAWLCRVGARLARQEGTVCAGCYALKGRYAQGTVRRANERRMAHADHPQWVDAMVFLVTWQAMENGVPYFRWFDTGDLQSLAMLQRIAEVARRTPEVQHWLPTREHGIVRRYLDLETPPENLVIRLSALMVDGEPPELGLPTSTVHRRQPPQGHRCPAYDGDGPPVCGACRACWDPQVPNISYPFH